MDFFEHQSAARRNTRVMVMLYALAVAAVVLAVDLVLAITYLNVADVQLAPGAGVAANLRAVPPGIHILGAAGTAALILLVSLYHVVRLSAGGEAVARMVGAREIPRDTRDPLERRLLNVIEEMAIASGTRVPTAFVMDDEAGINAFAAGHNVGNAVVAVTRGTLETLSREELQGVVAHEFSHILNGDVGLNIRMIGVLSGIVFIGAIGEFLLRSTRGSRNRDGDAKVAAAIALAGLALFLIGYIGLFFARLIKAAVSRQREFLADASAVQFTRNPDGIAGALDQIRASARGAAIENRHAEDMSHMYFGQAIKVWFGGIFDTHPPLEERIRRVRPGFQPSRYRSGRAQAPAAAASGDSLAAAGFAGGAASPAPAGQRASDAGGAWGRSAADSAKLVGTLDAGKVDFAARLIGRLPPELRNALDEPQGAMAVLIATLLAPREAVLEQQLQSLRAFDLNGLAGQARALMPAVHRLGPAFSLALVDLGLPAIKAAPEPQRRSLVPMLEAVIHADRRVSLREFVVLTLVKAQLAPDAGAGAAPTKPLAALREEIATLMSLVAHAGGTRGADAAQNRAVERAFEAGALTAGMAGLQLLPIGAVSLASAGAALEKLKGAAPLAKAVLVKALFAVVSADGTICLAQAELMRMIGAVLDCPLPPLFESLDPATLTA